jgi:redox-sensitive bicupin YhaK (pirin superfamily)
MNTTLYKANTRGYANHGWLKSYHTFSFAGYHNPERMHFGLMRVLNDDWVAPGAGFGKHPHDNMEIVSIPLAGTLAHSDSTGRNKEIKTGDVQIMSAGSGITHSEFNHSKSEAVEFLQIWIFPKENNIAPRYEQKTFDTQERIDNWQTLVSPEDKTALWINQDAYFSLANPKQNTQLNYQVKKEGNGLFLMVLEGSVTLNDTELSRRDAIGITDIDKLELTAGQDSELLLIELPMN